MIIKVLGMLLIMAGFAVLVMLYSEKLRIKLSLTDVDNSHILSRENEYASFIRYSAILALSVGVLLIFPLFLVKEAIGFIITIMSFVLLLAKSSEKIKSFTDGALEKLTKHPYLKLDDSKIITGINALSTPWSLAYGVMAIFAPILIWVLITVLLFLGILFMRNKKSNEEKEVVLPDNVTKDEDGDANSNKT